MRKAHRDRLITFQRVVTSESEFGEPVKSSASEIGRSWASVNYGRGDERRQAAIEGAKQSATFRVLKSATNSSVTYRDIIIFDGGEWDIDSIAPFERRELDFTATRRR